MSLRIFSVRIFCPKHDWNFCSQRQPLYNYLVTSQSWHLFLQGALFLTVFLSLHPVIDPVFTQSLRVNGFLHGADWMRPVPFCVGEESVPVLLTVQSRYFHYKYEHSRLKILCIILNWLILLLKCFQPREASFNRIRWSTWRGKAIEFFRILV